MQSDAAVAQQRRRFLDSLTAARLAVAVAGVGAAGLFVARILSWPSASTYDAWAYAAWGQALVRGERLVYNAATTPKPLATLLGAVVSPLPPARAMAMVVALALGALVASLLAVGFREGGALAGAFAVAAFLWTARLDEVVWFALIDGVTAAIVVAAVAFTGRTRMVLLILSGLLRPEGWLASALGGYVEMAGSRARKALFAVAAGALPFVLWTAFDLLVTGELFATRRFQEGVGAELGGRMPKGPGEALELFWRKTVAEGGTLVPVLGFLGLLVHAWRGRRTADFPFPLGLAGVWAIALIAETLYGFELNSRYILPLLALLALGCGLLAPDLLSSLVSRRPAWVWTATAVAIAATSLALARMDFGRRAEKWERISLTAHRSIPAVEPVLECGRLGLVGRKHVGGTIGQLGAMTRTSLARFERVGEGAPSRYAGILAVNGSQADRLPPWPVKQTPLGPLAVNPNCQAAGDE
jgi:hypothetical protein